MDTEGKVKHDQSMSTKSNLPVASCVTCNPSSVLYFPSTFLWIICSAPYFWSVELQVDTNAPASRRRKHLPETPQWIAKRPPSPCQLGNLQVGAPSRELTQMRLKWGHQTSKNDTPSWMKLGDFSSSNVNVRGQFDVLFAKRWQSHKVRVTE